MFTCACVQDQVYLAMAMDAPGVLVPVATEDSAPGGAAPAPEDGNLKPEPVQAPPSLPMPPPHEPPAAPMPPPPPAADAYLLPASQPSATPPGSEADAALEAQVSK